MTFRGVITQAGFCLGVSVMKLTHLRVRVYFLLGLFLGACSSPSGNLLPQASLPPPDNDGGITITSPDSSGSVTITAEADTVPIDSAVVIMVDSDASPVNSTSFSDIDASALSCFDGIPECPELDSFGRCRQVADATGAFTATVPAALASTITISIIDEHSCVEISEYEVTVKEVTVTAAAPTSVESTPALPETTSGDVEVDGDDTILAILENGVSEEETAQTGPEITDMATQSGGNTGTGNDAATTSSTVDGANGSGGNTSTDIATRSGTSTDSTVVIITDGEMPSDTETPLDEEAETVTRVASIYQPANLDRFRNPVLQSIKSGGLYLATQLVDGRLTYNKLVTFKGTALMRVQMSGIDPGLVFSLPETQTVSACAPLMKADQSYDRAFIVRNALPNLWQGAELFVSDNYNPTKSPPDVPTRYIGLGEIAKAIGLVGTNQIRMIPYIDSIGDEVVMVVGVQQPGFSGLRYYMLTTDRHTAFCTGFVPTTVTYLMETNNPVRGFSFTEKYSDQSHLDILRLDVVLDDASYFIDMDSLEVFREKLAPYPTRNENFL